MPKTSELSKLFHAISAQDWAGAQAAASRLADSEEEHGHHAAAARLRGALKPNGHRYLNSQATSPTETAGVIGMLAPAATSDSLADVTLRPEQDAVLRTVIREWHQRARLSKHHVRRRNKLLFHGPPGCGKSMAARAIAREVGLPAYVVRLDAVIGAFLGQTAVRVRELFRFAETAPCVLVLDEVDALGRQRGDSMDVGELDRVVISVMQQLEHSEPLGFVVATSNLLPRLDPALVRRFDLGVEFPPPTKAERIRFARHRARVLRIPVTSVLTRRIGTAKAYADVERVLVDEKRRLLLRGS